MKDQLPDLLRDAPGRAELDAVRAHVAACESCRAELAFLRDVHRFMPAPRVDVARIAAAIPPYRPVPVWARLARSPLARMAAVLVLAVGVATVASERAEDRVAPDTASVTRVSPPTGELHVGTLSDISESDLETLLDDLGDLEAVTPTEVDVEIVPAFEGNGE